MEQETLKAKSFAFDFFFKVLEEIDGSKTC